MCIMSGVQGVYSPIPQNLSDTESDDDLHNAIPSQINYRINKKNPSVNYNSTHKMTNGFEPMHNHYHGLDDIEESSNGFAIVNSDSDTVGIMGNEKKPMSPIRRVCFVLSILACIFTIVIFLWVIPCSESLTCTPISSLVKTQSWNKGYTGLELKGVINIVEGISGHSKNLIFLYRGDMINQFENGTYKEGGVISIVASSGDVVWFREMKITPADIDCSLVDVDKNGSPDCLVLGNRGLLESLNPISGIPYWSVEVAGFVINSMEFPVILMDLDKDGVNELFTTCKFNTSENNFLIIISGRVGKIIGQPLEIAGCSSIFKLAINERLEVTFICHSNETDVFRTIPFKTVYSKIANKSLDDKNITNATPKQHQKYGQSKDTENQTNIYEVNGRQLIVENHGRCPHCRVSVQLIDKRNGANNVTWDYQSTGVYGMVPASLSFSQSKNYISGFVLKFWQWATPTVDNSNITKIMTQEEPYRDVFLQSFDIGVLKRTWNMPLRGKRSVPKDLYLIRHTKTVHNLTERVVLISFNETDMHIVNASQSDVKQICIQNEEMFCQPELAYQENSLTISDLDGDGSQELVSYLSTFVDSGDVNTWKLQTSVRVVRLEAQIPKLYEAVTKH